MDVLRWIVVALYAFMFQHNIMYSLIFTFSNLQNKEQVLHILITYLGLPDLPDRKTGEIIKIPTIVNYSFFLTEPLVAAITNSPDRAK